MKTSDPPKTDLVPGGERPGGIRELARARSEILKLPADKALAAILDHPQSAALVRSFPETDFYLLVQDIGPADALPLLALASERQWEHIVDLEVWRRDRLEVPAATRWLNLLMQADPRRLLAWLLSERLNFAELYLFHNIEVRIREHDQDPGEFGEGFFTLDQVYYVRLLKPLPEAGGSAADEEERTLFITRLLERLAESDHRLYQSVLLEAAHVIPAEAEEEEYRWRSVRLAEKGFEPFDEAVGVYQPLTPDQLGRRPPKAMPEPPPPEEEAGEPPAVPGYPLKEAPPESHFSRALARIEPGERLERLQWEFANLCNRLIVADGKAVRDREHLRAIVAKACGYIGIALERLTEAPPKVDPERAAALLLRHRLGDLFRVGFGAPLALKWEAERWLAQAWFARAGLRLSFWGEQWMGFLGGILLKRPLFYDNYRRGTLYREFDALADVDRAAEALRQVQAVDRLLAAMDPQAGLPGRRRPLTWKSLLLTRWAARRLGLAAAGLEPIPRRAFAPFFRELFPAGPASNPAAAPPVPDAMKTAFLRWAAAEAGWSEEEVSGRLGPIFEELFDEVASEYGGVSAENLDPRFVTLFLLQAD